MCARSWGSADQRRTFMSTPNTPQDLDAAVVDTIETVSACLDKAAQLYQTKEAEFKAVRSLIPEVVEALVSNGRIEPEEKEATARALADPVQTLQLLKWAA